MLLKLFNAIYFARLTLEGVFSNGYLEGPVRGIDDRGNLCFIGAFKEGIANGHCWLAREGQGWIHGPVNSQGRFTGDDIMFVYPDLTTCILGTFKNEILVTGKASRDQYYKTFYLETTALKY